MMQGSARATASEARRHEGVREGLSDMNSEQRRAGRAKSEWLVPPECFMPHYKSIMANATTASKTILVKCTSK